MIVLQKHCFYVAENESLKVGDKHQSSLQIWEVETLDSNWRWDGQQL